MVASALIERSPGLPDDVIWTLARGELTVSDRQTLGVRLAESLDAGATPAEIVISLASHGLVPLAYRRLVSTGDVDLPAPLRAEIAAEFRRHTLTRFRYTRRLRELLDALADAGVEAVPYKGPALAIQLFGNFAMRQYGDLDILVRPADAERAQQALLGAGLIRHRTSTESWDEYLYRVRHSFELRDPRERVVIELHWSLADRYLGMDVSVDWLFEDRETIDLLGRPTRVMSGERLLLALCLHGAKHLWERAVWLAEVAEIVRRPGYVRWDQALGHADRAGLGRALRACLILARDLFGAAPPHPWVRTLDADLSAIRLSEMLSERLTARPTGRLHNRFRLGYLAQASAARRARFCWRVATDLSERDMRTIGSREGSPLVHALKRTLRLARALQHERYIW